MDYAKVVATIEGLTDNVESLLYENDLLEESNGGQNDDR